MDENLVSEEREMYVFLDFGDALDKEYFNKPNIFFKAIRLDEEQPVVQLEDVLYVGSCQNAVGTNVFFEENEAKATQNIFEKETPISLTYFTKQIREIKLKRLEKKLNFEGPEENNCASDSSHEGINTAGKDEPATDCKNEPEPMQCDELPSCSDSTSEEIEEEEEEEEEKGRPKYTEAERLEKLDEFTRAKINELNINVEKYKKLVELAKVPMKFDVPQEKVDVPENLVVKYIYRWLSRKYLQGSSNVVIREGSIKEEQNSDIDLDSVTENTPFSVRHLLILKEIGKLENSNEQITKYGLKNSEYIEVLKMVASDIKNKLENFHNVGETV